MRRIRAASFLAAALITVLITLAPLAPTASAVPIGQPAQPGPTSAERIRLEVDSMAPRFVDAATTQVTITGQVTNTGDRRIDEVEVQLQRGEALDSERALRESASQATDSAKSPFIEVSPALEPGESAPVKVAVPVGGGERTLGITEPGVYPVLVNINGRPEFGGRARLAAVSVQLPVLALPDGPAAQQPATARGVSIVWPLLDTQPRRIPTTDDQLLLTDDKLADSLDMGGRLYGLVNAIRTLDTSSSLLGSLCFAVDPDLLQTVELMSNGYRVRGAGGQTTDGEGAEVAKDWLGMVREVTRGRCVFSVPYADTDLAALSRAGAVELTQLAMARSSIVNQVLSPVQQAKGIVWPAGGTFDQRTLVDLAGTPTTVLANPAHLQNAQGNAPYLVNGMQTASPVHAAPYDPLIADALAGPQQQQEAAGTKTLEQDSSGSVQNGLAALMFRTAFAEGTENDAPLLITPPRRWTAPAAELKTFLDTTQRLFDGGFATPAPLPDGIHAGGSGTTDALTYTVSETAAEVPGPIIADAVAINTAKRDLLSAMRPDNTTGVDPSTLLDPTQDGLLRATSTAWRGRVEDATAAVDDVRGQLDQLRGLVTVTDPGRPLTLASSDSPIPVVVHNGLPVAIAVHVNLHSTPGLRLEQSPNFLIPANHSGRQSVNAEVIRSGRFNVDVSLSTPGSTPLGSNVRLEVNSTSYGIITVAVTGTAGAILVLLVAVRIFRRVKAARAGGTNGDGST